MQFVDFMRVEDIGTMPGQTPFEQETKKEIAAISSTPMDDLMAVEEEIRERMAANAKKRRQRELIRSVGLSKRQRIVFELCYVSGLRNVEVADLLEIAPATVARLRQKVFSSLDRALKKQRIKQALINRVPFIDLTRKQRDVTRLYLEQGLSTKEVAAKTGRTLRSVQRIIKRVRRRLFQG